LIQIFSIFSRWPLRVATMRRPLRHRRVCARLSRASRSPISSPPDGSAPFTPASTETGWIGEPQPALPLYWAYGKLELSFDARPPHAIDFFQIEFAHLLSGDCEILAGGRIVLDLQGLDGRSRPSDVLRVMRDRVTRDGAAPLDVLYSRPTTTASFALSLSNGAVTLVFDSSFPEETLPGLAALADPAWLRRCDAFAQLDSIYVHVARQTQAPSEATRKVAAAEYLAAVDGAP
jgi:hypothetical protein